MSTRIFIPTPLRQYAGNHAQVEVQAGNVSDALRQLVDEHPGLREHLFADDGSIRSFVNIYLNDEDIRYLSDERKGVGERDTISIIPAIAGGVEA